jgi:hypothetical protein
LWLPSSLERRRDPPTSHRDSLVVMEPGVVVGRKGEATNESLRLVGGPRCRRCRWKDGKSHQRVSKTRWWCWRLAWSVERREKPPTSHEDSLVVVGAGVVGGEGGKPTNESRRLVGGPKCQRRCWKEEKTHQRVVGTRWWPSWPASSMEAKRNLPTSPYDSLVVVVAGVVAGKKKRPTNES